jgi:hypothetical protein
MHAHWILGLDRTLNFLNQLCPNASGGRVLESEDDLANVLEVGSTLDNKNIALIIFSIGLRRLEVVAVPFGDPF